jgi:hypothetical protein
MFTALSEDGEKFIKIKECLGSSNELRLTYYYNVQKPEALVLNCEYGEDKEGVEVRNVLVWKK